MFSAKWFIPLACVATSLVAQTNDINGLAAAAGHYVASGMAASRDPETLGLCKMLGGLSTPQGDVLMSKASDVQHWTFLYRINSAGAADPGTPEPSLSAFMDPGSLFEAVPEPDPAGAPKRHLAVTAECNAGIFGSFHYSSKPVKGLKSLDNIWIAASLDSAISSLNASGYVRGFTAVGVLRPGLPNWPDELVYVFNCPFERRLVAVSCQSAALAWTYDY